MKVLQKCLVKIEFLNPSLAGHDKPCLSKQCRSRSVGLIPHFSSFLSLFPSPFFCLFLRISYAGPFEPHLIGVDRAALQRFNCKSLADRQMRHYKVILTKPALMAQYDACLPGDQEVADSIPTRSSKILSWSLIIKYFLQSLDSPFC